jgi:hypothetical protein
MEIKLGQRILYTFPEPADFRRTRFLGNVEFVGETFIYIKNDRNIKLKVSFKNFHLLEPVEPEFNFPQ